MISCSLTISWLYCMMPWFCVASLFFNSDNNDVLTFCPKKRAFSESTEIPAPGPDLSAPFFVAGWTKKENINWKNSLVGSKGGAVMNALILPPNFVQILVLTPYNNHDILTGSFLTHKWSTERSRKFVVDSLLCSKRFFSGYFSFLLSLRAFALIVSARPYCAWNS